MMLGTTTMYLWQEKKPETNNFLDELWNAAPQQARTRSSRKQVADEWRRVKDKPDTAAALMALKAWCRCDDWKRGYVPGLHRWIKNRQWENVPGPIRPISGIAALSDTDKAKLAEYARQRESLQGYPDGAEPVKQAMKKHLAEWKEKAAS